MNSSTDKALILRQVSKQVTVAEREVAILESISLDVEAGDTVAITGRSGSGKSTLLGLMAGLDRPSTGEIWLAGQPLHNLDEDGAARVRLQSVGFVFQSFQLLSHVNALKNVILPLNIAKTDSMTQRRKRGEQALAQVGLADKQLQRVNTLSGGEQQRVAIARALINRPDIIFADEPTGNLDGQTATEIEQLLFTLNEHTGATLVIVTHDDTLAQQCKKQYQLAQGQLTDRVQMKMTGRSIQSKKYQESESL